MTEVVQVQVSTKDLHPNPFQPRLGEDPDAIAELADSIERDGLLQVPTARPVNAHYELAFGHSRLAAFRLLESQGHPEFAQMPVFIRQLSDLQMFEHAVAENIKRRALTPIEQARSMQAYMEKFGKTSEETGAFFGVSAETVRGKVRLLDLSEQAQEKLATGLITEGTARTLLSVQRVASRPAMNKVLERISILDATITPDEVIDAELSRLEDVTEMWNRDGKPRAGDDLWLLDMKNFPNALLPELTQTDLADALKIERDEKMLTNIRRQVEDETLFTSMEDVLRRVFSKPDQATLLEKGLHLLNPPACSACPFYTKVRGSHYCGMKVCYERKFVAWCLHELKQASRMLGIPAYDTDHDGAYVVLESAWMGNGNPSVALFNKKSPDLRLILRSEVKGGDHHQSGYKGVPDRFVTVIAVGAALEKLSSGRRTSDNRFTPAARLQQKRDRIFKRRRKELIWLFTATGAGLFDAVNKAALENITGWHFLGVDDRPPSEVIPADNAPANVKAEYLRRLMVWCLVDRVYFQTHNARPTKLSQVAERLIGLAKEWDIKGPHKGLLKIAADGDAEIASASVPAPKTKKSR